MKIAWAGFEIDLEMFTEDNVDRFPCWYTSATV